MEALPQDLADFLVTRNFDPEYFDDQGQPSEAGDAKTIKFDYIASSGKKMQVMVPQNRFCNTLFLPRFDASQDS